MRIGGIYKPNALLGQLPRRRRLLPVPLQRPASRRRPAEHDERRSRYHPCRRRLCSRPTRTSRSRRGPSSRSRSRRQVNQLLGLVYALLALAVVIALIGIVNTLMLSVFERTHEIGLLRAVGMKRRQIRAMIRSEAVILSLFGAIIGIVVGTALGTAFAASLKQQGITDIVDPLRQTGGVPRHRRPAGPRGGHLAGAPRRRARRPGRHRRRLIATPEATSRPHRARRQTGAMVELISATHRAPGGGNTSEDDLGVRGATGHGDDVGVSVAVMDSPSGVGGAGPTAGVRRVHRGDRGGGPHRDRGRVDHGGGGPSGSCRPPGQWVRYSTPGPGGARYVAVCVPAFSPDAVNRDDDASGTP